MIYKTLAAIHGVFGLFALITYWLAAFAKKGTPWHRNVGRAYLIAMLGIVSTAGPMAVLVAISGKTGVATFLAYLVVITATGMWQGWRAIKRKRDQNAFRDRTYLAVAILNLAASLVVLAVGYAMSQSLLMGFSVVGIFGGVQMLIRRASPLESPRWWLREHFAAMIGCGVATHIAFLAIGSDRLIRAFGIDPPGWYHLLAWFVPLPIAVIAGFRINRKYMPKAPAAPTLAGAV